MDISKLLQGKLTALREMKARAFHKIDRLSNADAKQALQQTVIFMDHMIELVEHLLLFHGATSELPTSTSNPSANIPPQKGSIVASPMLASAPIATDMLPNTQDAKAAEAQSIQTIKQLDSSEPVPANAANAVVQAQAQQAVLELDPSEPTPAATQANINVAIPGDMVTTVVAGAKVDAYDTSRGEGMRVVAGPGVPPGGYRPAPQPPAMNIQPAESAKDANAAVAAALAAAGGLGAGATDVAPATVAPGSELPVVPTMEQLLADGRNEQEARGIINQARQRRAAWQQAQTQPQQPPR